MHGRKESFRSIYYFNLCPLLKFGLFCMGETNHKILRNFTIVLFYFLNVCQPWAKLMLSDSTRAPLPSFLPTSSTLHFSSGDAWVVYSCATRSILMKFLTFLFFTFSIPNGISTQLLTSTRRSRCPPPAPRPSSPSCRSRSHA
jgi:hypothetical protein